jgi:Insertion element 4 transposase N-terminal
VSDPATDRMRARGGVPAWQHIGLGVLAEYVPAALIDEVLTQTGAASRRVRLLPARVVVLFVLALTLFGGYGYRSVWRQLAGTVTGLAAAAPTSSALTQARQRLGPKPLAAVFARVRGVQTGPDTPGAFRFGLRLVAWDAIMLDVPDTEDNATAFRRSRNGHATGGFPQVRLLALIEVESHAVIDAAFGSESEQVLARRVLGSLQPGMLLLADRNFPSHELWRQAAGSGAHLLWRIKASRHLPRVATFTDGSWLAVLCAPGSRGRAGIWVRVIDYRRAHHRPARPHPYRSVPADHHADQPDPRPRARAGRLLPRALGVRNRVPGAEGRPTRTPPRAALTPPGRRDPGNLRLPDHLSGRTRSDDPRRRKRRPRP